MLPEEIKLETEAMSIDEEFIDEEENASTYIFFDFECTQDDQLECSLGYNPDEKGKYQNCLQSICGSYEHKPNLCVVQKVCTVYMNIEMACDSCGQREKFFAGDSTLDEFCQWLFSEDSTIVCHNFQ